MAFNVKEIYFKNTTYSLSEISDEDSNKITILVGPNGVGKSRILSALAHFYTNRKDPNKNAWDYPTLKTSNSSSDFPSKVVTQTFSPFSRFPVERNKKIALSEYLIKEESNYSTIGFTRNMGFRGSVSKEVLGRMIRKVLTQPEYAEPIAKAMISLNFEPKISLEYITSPYAKSVDFNNPSDKGLLDSINLHLSKISNSKNELLPSEYRVAREIDNNSISKLAEIIFTSIRGIRLNLSKDDSKKINYSLDIYFQNLKPSLEVLNNFATLMRLGFIRIANAFINTRTFDNIDSNYNGSGSINLTDTSSGEQHILSSLFGVVAEAKNNSLILIDEPELSLHPEWQTRIVDLIKDTLSVFSGCHIFIATHSALVAQRALELGIEVISIGNSNNSEMELINKKHTSIEETLLEVFELAVKDSTYVPRLILSLVLDAEKNPDNKPKIIEKLNKLKNTYTKSSNPDKKILSLIDESFSILE
jgi:predicted ATP-dependent endonuclease of OLD family